MARVPPTHPRYESLMTRERLVAAERDGVLVAEGLIAHGRGEAFDYLLGERTPSVTGAAYRAAAATLLAAKRPVVSVNGNTAALAADGVAALQRSTGCRVEVNLFHRTEERVRCIVKVLEAAGCRDVLGPDPDARIPGLDHDRALCRADGIHAADAVVVPIEDGDRCEALVAMGKRVVAVDLNPLSRTARAATVTIVDSVTRALPRLARETAALRGAPRAEQERIAAAFDNAAALRDVLAFVADRLRALGDGGGPRP